MPQRCCCGGRGARTVKTTERLETRLGTSSSAAHTHTSKDTMPCSARRPSPTHGAVRSDRRSDGLHPAMREKARRTGAVRYDIGSDAAVTHPATRRARHRCSPPNDAQGDRPARLGQRLGAGGALGPDIAHRLVHDNYSLCHTRGMAHVLFFSIFLFYHHYNYSYDYYHYVLYCSFLSSSLSSSGAAAAAADRRDAAMPLEHSAPPARERPLKPSSHARPHHSDGSCGRSPDACQRAHGSMGPCACGPMGP